MADMTREEIEELLLSNDERIKEEDSYDDAEHLFRIGTAIRQLLQEREWRPIESAPRDGTEVLLWEDGDISVGRYLAKAYRPGWYSDGNDPEWDYPSADKPTHWMPLPLPPSPSTKEGE